MSLLVNSSQSNTPEIIFAPATESQLEVWFSCLLGGDDANRSYNLSVSLTLTGDVNRSNLEKSLQKIIDRHEALRSSFSKDGTQVLISGHRDLNLRFEDIRNYSDTDDFVSGYVKSEVNISFDLVNGPLYKLTLFRKADEEHILVFTVHHIICDGWSMGLLLEELSTIYTALELQKAPELAEPVSFYRYALQQKEFSESSAYKDIEQYWVDQFKENVPVLEIPTDFERPLLRTTKSQRYDSILEPKLLSDLRNLGNKEKASLAITLRAVFEILLSDLSGQEDIVLGFPTAGQAATENFNLISHCVNLLPLRSFVKDDLTFKEYLNTRKFDTLDAYDNQQYTFGSLLKKLNIPRDNSRVPLVSVVFSIDNGTGENLHFEGLTYKLASNKREHENFEIFVNATGSGQSFLLECTYNEQLFKPDSIKRMMDDFKSMLNAVADDPDIRIKDILLQRTIELNRKISEWNDTGVPYSYDSKVFDIISEMSIALPDNIAIKFKDQTITYRDLNEKANQAAAYLIKHGVKRGDRVAFAVERSPEMVIIMIAIMKAGAAYIPIDPSYPKKRIQYMLADSSSRFLITSQKYADQLSDSGTPILTGENIFKEASGYSKTNPQVEVNGHDLAYVIYTSGSSGQPKGIAIEHHSLSNFLFSMQKAPGISAEDKLLAITTISFDISGLEIYLPLITGAVLLLCADEVSRNAEELLGLIESEKVTIMQATPSTWKMMLETGWQKHIPIKALCGGEALPEDIATLLLSRVTSLWNMYGPTETTIWSSAKLITNPEGPITIGRPIDNTQIYILDKQLNPVSPGNTGEIYIAGEGLARGYHNNPDLTASSFITNPFSSADDSKMYRTGDLGLFMPDGEIRCLGRIDSQIKIRGHRVELGAIEHMLNKQADIKESIVLMRQDQAGDQRLVAYVVYDPVPQHISVTGFGSGHITLSRDQSSALKQALSEIFPQIMVPSDFVAITKIPLLPNGKTDRNSLPKPDHENNIDIPKANLPASAVQKIVAKVWEEILGVQNVTLDDDFFELGGHSLIAVHVIDRLEAETGIRVPFTSLFRFSSLENFADLFQTHQNDTERLS